MTCASARETFVAKGTRCLIYKAADAPVPGPRSSGRLIEAVACTSCPLRSPDDREHGFARYLAQTSGQRP